MYTIKELKNENPHLNQIIIKNEKIDFVASIYPNLGASIQKISFKNTEIIDGITNNEKGLDIYKKKYNSSFLFPFTNRISNGTYLFNDKTYNLEINETSLNNSLHGHIYNKTFYLKEKNTSHESATVTLIYINKGTSKGFPFSYEIDIKYTFTNNNISIDFNIINNDNKSFPFGIGWHPYFKTTNLNSCILDFNADNKYFLDKKMIPTEESPLNFKTPLLIEDTLFDDCFITKKSEVSLKTSEFNINLDFSSKTPNSFLQIYTPPKRDCIAVEPMSCAPNSFNNKNGLLILKPYDSYKWTVRLKISQKH